MLDKIKLASVPEKFSQDFVTTKLALKGGTARSIIPFIKKMGLVTSDGTPTDRYREFRNSEKSGYAMAAAVRELYEELFEMNEYAHELEPNKLKGLIVELTGAEANSTVVQKTLYTFNALKKLANFEPPELEKSEPYTGQKRNSISIPLAEKEQESDKGNIPSSQSEGINLSYTINLNLPATNDIEIFNAIFKSLKIHLLQS